MRLMSVVIKTREEVPASLFLRWPKLAQEVRQILRLDGVPELSIDSTRRPETTVTITYDRMMADSADFNDSFGDVEGEVVALVKECLGFTEVQKVVKKVDLTLA